MTYDPTSPSSPEPDESSPVADAMADAREAFNRSGFSTPTGMVALAAFVLIGVELIFNVIMSEYGIDWSLLALALLAVIVYFGKGAYDRVAPVDALLKLVGMLIASLVAFHILWDLRYADSNLDEIGDILGALFVAGAGVLAFLGARAIK